jgi:hypothetical protein
MANPIKVHEKALAHLSKGLYRSPASAIRELISNGWDAGATKVDIFTNAPTFTGLTVHDNGSGMSEEQFRALMDGGIGNSSKRDPLRQKSSAYNRPVLGRLGIGLLGIAQICTRFKVISKSAGSKAFAVEVRIEDIVREQVDANDPTVVQTDPNDPSQRNIFIGTWESLPVPKLDADWTGTQVIVTNLHPGFTQSFIATLRPLITNAEEQDQEMSGRVGQTAFPSPEQAQAAMPPLSWEKAVELSAEKESVMMRGDYWRFLWELAAACPVPYIRENAVPNGVVKDDQSRLESYQFTVTVDNRVLRKPVLLKKRTKGYSTVRLSHETIVRGVPLRLHGYLCVQEGNQLRPAELRGILIRIKEIGVGYYDPSLLDWQTNQGPRSRWITGEIFVEAGLEDAMNVDRDSFNRYHPEYKELQAYVHKELKRLFSTVYSKIQHRSAESAEKRATVHREVLSDVLEELSGKTVKLVSRETPKRDSVIAPMVSVQSSSRGITVDLSSARHVPAKAAVQNLAAAIMALYEVAQSQGKTSSERRDIFAASLLSLLKEW